MPHTLIVTAGSFYQKYLNHQINKTEESRRDAPTLVVKPEMFLVGQQFDTIIVTEEYQNALDEADPSEAKKMREWFFSMVIPRTTEKGSIIYL